MNAFTRRVRRIVLGPTDAEISARSQALGGPPYPIPHIDTAPPEHLRLDLGAAEARLSGTWVRGGIVTPLGEGWALADEAPLIRPAAQDRLNAADTIRAARDDNSDYYWATAHNEADANPVPYSLNDPTGITAAAPLIARTPTYDGSLFGPDVCRCNDHVDPHRHTASDPRGKSIFDDETEADMTDIPRAAAEPADEADVHTYGPNPVTDSGVHAAPEPAADVRTVRAACPTCEGVGYVERTINELLRESIALIPVDGGDGVISEFYSRLLAAAPSLIPLFPRDLLTAATQEGASPGAMQRDKLLQALLALSELYGGSADDMARLDAALETFGRHHAAFQRPDGTVQGATEAEYDAVRDVLFGTLIDTAGRAWLPEYTAAWLEAYSYAKTGMLWAQYHSGFTSARYTRRDASRG